MDREWLNGLSERFAQFMYDQVWSRFGKIGPGSMKEAHAVHRGFYLGFVKIWTPRGLYRLSRRYQKLEFKEFEDRELQYEGGVAVAFYSLKMGAILVALEIGVDPLSRCGENLRSITETLRVIR